MTLFSGFWPIEIQKLLPREQLLRWKHKFVKNLKLFCNLSCQVLPMQWRAKFRILEMQKTIVWKRLNNKSLEYNVLIYWHAKRNSIAGWLVVDCRRTLSRHCDCKCIWTNCKNRKYTSLCYDKLVVCGAFQGMIGIIIRSHQAAIPRMPAPKVPPPVRLQMISDGKWIFCSRVHKHAKNQLAARFQTWRKVVLYTLDTWEHYTWHDCTRIRAHYFPLHHQLSANGFNQVSVTRNVNCRSKQDSEPSALLHNGCVSLVHYGCERENVNCRSRQRQMPGVHPQRL